MLCIIFTCVRPTLCDFIVLKIKNGFYFCESITCRKCQSTSFVPNAPKLTNNWTNFKPQQAMNQIVKWQKALFWGSVHNEKGCPFPHIYFNSCSCQEKKINLKGHWMEGENSTVKRIPGDRRCAEKYFPMKKRQSPWTATVLLKLLLNCRVKLIIHSNSVYAGCGVASIVNTEREKRNIWLKIEHSWSY